MFSLLHMNLCPNYLSFEGLKYEEHFLLICELSRVVQCNRCRVLVLQQGLAKRQTRTLESLWAAMSVTISVGRIAYSVILLSMGKALLPLSVFRIYLWIKMH